ncbi:reverse transcriptase domain-containing protein [uncultured Acinetobacter sp.]|uniref:reverse transcriptase domain-containing protein n=1 Tax=uncultured Acinetobacter sp. TaxID=165433 RepID=UPI00258B7DF9|nr:reverse transcriptase domain-containing protein [uncultured Acinetobacter sp.]
MSYLKKLKACSSQKDLAHLLGYTEKAFTHILFSDEIHKKYHQFTIPKKTGGVRMILAPKPDLNLLQTRLNFILTESFNELEKKRLEESSYIECIASHAFRKKINISLPTSKKDRTPIQLKEINFGIYSNAKKHVNKKYILNIDLENFFENIRFSRVVGFFSKNRDFSLDYDVALLLAQIVTYRSSKMTEAYLPQGSPCSPIISNLIGNMLDIKMLKLAKKYKCTYTRYADDLTFSTNTKEMPSDLVFFEEDIWKAGKVLTKNISSCGFKINHKKTRLNNKYSRQEVTSLTVNRKVNINKQYYRYSRSMVNEYCSKGIFYKSKYHMDLLKNNTNALNGILSFIYQIKKYESSYSDTKAREFSQLDSIEKLYVKFLFHYYFVFPQRTLIIGEGYTDPLHLKLAFHKLYNSSSAYIKFTSLQSTKRFSKLMGLSGGTGLLQKFLINYNTINKSKKNTSISLHYSR